jgi:hypothetical protein
MKQIFSALLLATAASAAAAAPIPGLFNTGTDASNVALPGGNGVTDPHYSVLSSTIGGVATGVQAVTYYNGAYFPNDANSRWISHSSNGNPGSGTTTFRLSFDLTGLNPATAQITGRWGVDNLGVIFLNGVNTGVSLPVFTTANFTSLASFAINTGFVSGINTLDFAIQDLGQPLAFRVDDLAGTADPRVPGPVPAPAALALFGLGLAGIALRRR